MAKLTEDEIKQQREINQINKADLEVVNLLSIKYDGSMYLMLSDIVNDGGYHEFRKLLHVLDPDMGHKVIGMYDIDAIHEQVDYLENEAIQEIEAILEDIESGEGYAKNWLNSLKLTIRTKSEKIKKELNNLSLGEG